MDLLKFCTAMEVCPEHCVSDFGRDDPRGPVREPRMSEVLSGSRKSTVGEILCFALTTNQLHCFCI